MRRRLEPRAARRGACRLFLRLALPGLVLAALLPLSACFRSGPPLLILISVDTLRADHLGCYGYGRETSPNLDRLAAGSVLFEAAFSHAPSTLVAHASLFTSLVPQHHGASHARRRALGDDVLTLAEVLRREGWATASINGGGQLAAEFGLAQGFDVYESLSRAEDRFSSVVQRGLRWIDAHPDRPRFLFLHTYEVHRPLEPPREILESFSSEPGAPTPDWKPPIGSDDLRWFLDRYDAEIRSMDGGLGELVAGLRSRRLWRRALVVFTSDHGEEMGERGHAARHSHTLFDELLRVPLLVKLPGEAPGRRVTTSARLIDVAPTVLASLGLDAPPSFKGRDLLAETEGPRPLVAQRDTATVEPVAALRTPRYKLIGKRLYDLREDPGERRNVAAQHPEIAGRLGQWLADQTDAEPRPPGEAVTLEPETEAQLRALGYLE